MAVEVEMFCLMSDRAARPVAEVSTVVTKPALRVVASPKMDLAPMSMLKGGLFVVVSRVSLKAMAYPGAK